MQHGDTRRRILVLNGPNLGSLGTRQPDIYGNGSLADLVAELVRFGERVGVEVTHRQSDDEAELISIVASADADGIVLNSGALAHTSRALGDAVRSSGRPTVEVHITDIRRREAWRSVSFLEDACVYTIVGRGRVGYRDAIRHLVNRWAAPFETVRYGPHPLNLGELRKGEGEGVVVLVHGGVWRPSHGRDAMESLAVDLHRRGIASWNIGYRRSGEGGGWPGSGHDVLTAIDHASGMGPVTVIGHSAGGYLANWAAARAATPPRHVVVLAPIVDLEMTALDPAIAADTQALLDSGAPARVVPGGVPTLVVHGRQDTEVPVEHSLGISVDGAEVRIVDAGHFDMLDPTKPHWPPVVERLTERAGSATN